MARRRRNPSPSPLDMSRDQIRISRRELKKLQRHMGQDGAFSRLFMAGFLRRHAMPLDVLLEVARAADRHAIDPRSAPKGLQLPDGRRAIVDHAGARIERNAPTS